MTIWCPNSIRNFQNFTENIIRLSEIIPNISASNYFVSAARWVEFQKNPKTDTNHDILTKIFARIVLNYSDKFKMFTLAPNYFTSEDPDKKVSKVHKCSICGHRFRLSIHLNSHVTNFHEALKNRKCNDCGRVYADLNDLKLHRIERHGAKLKKPKKLLNQSLNNSFKAFSPGRIFTPPMARRTFSIFRTPTPNRRFTTIKNFTPGSSKRNSSVKTLFKTSKTPKVGNRYLCIACGRTLISKPGLKRYDFLQGSH